MRLAASNIAWKSAEDAAAAEALREVGAEGVEIAPTAVWPKPLEASDAEIREYRRRWESRGLRIVSMQALLFGRPELRIFGDEAARKATFDYLAGIIRLGGQLGATALVFGSPKNRAIGELPRSVAEELALPFFRGLGEFAVQHGTALCIEPNPPAYGADFITTAAEGLELVRKVGSRGFRLHLDAGGMTMTGELLDSSAFAEAVHFHASEPNLAPVGSGGTRHEDFARNLRSVGYRGWVSLEMRASGETGNIEPLRKALHHAASAYRELLSAPVNG
ncbi:sugar phosphate isomerase/epimerase [Vitiosangium sp. GDMCC 1.1324]|uniref:sugar phosphate isomerase/epimerase family protein n=1 Tax=Vitiosangium sp. (strain GDMCC 1.1324) TaxID=2138576 RepID=UPI000D3ADE8C|nr:sugar phosphate isomerase/epimerase family protein [Vitiosangium sp. GDMCC 1.1324]PTL80227.1 sugar phosphate isomerase/epimerase [Vitiosangium sp. GDMCC 1.1324]